MAEPQRPATGNEPTTFNLLFVCTGNTCRSPMASVIAERAVRERGWPHVAVRSAGTGVGGGAPAAEHAQAVAAEQGLDLASHQARPLGPEDVDWADLILAMGPAHVWAVADLGGAEKVALLTEFLGEEGDPDGIADPFGSGLDSYRRTFKELERAVEGLLQRLEPILSP